MGINVTVHSYLDDSYYSARVENVDYDARLQSFLASVGRFGLDRCLSFETLHDIRLLVKGQPVTCDYRLKPGDSISILPREEYADSDALLNLLICAEMLDEKKLHVEAQMLRMRFAYRHAEFPAEGMDEVMQQWLVNNIQVEIVGDSEESLLTNQPYYPNPRVVLSAQGRRIAAHSLTNLLSLHFINGEWKRYAWHITRGQEIRG